MKGIILAGGSGTRLYPSTVTVSKQLLPIYDKPTSHYALSTLIGLGISEILIISNFVNELRGLYGDGSHLGISIDYAEQKQPRGIAEAFIIGEQFIGDDSVALILGDNIFTGRPTRWCYNIREGAIIFGCDVQNPEEYGVVDTRSDVLRIIEKPKQYVGRTAVTGLYMYDSTVVERAKCLVPSERDELEITDLNNTYLEYGGLTLEHLPDTVAWFDTGNPDAMFDATMYVKSIQDRNHTMIGSPELTAYRNARITLDHFQELIDKMPNCSYSKHLRATI